jgi:CRISPR-associated Csx2 family protein
MWDVFLEHQGVSDEDVLALIEAVQEERVDAPMLATHEKRLSEKLGLPVKCLLIPYARDEQEQVIVLNYLAQVVSQGETIGLDVTHGFRHLPMLALVAARYLTHVANAKIDGIHYGALEMTGNDETPVLRLDGLLKMLDWVEALAIYDKDGDYGIFGKLLEKDGFPADRARQLEKAAYFERISNPVQASQTLAGNTGVFATIEKHNGSLSALFKETLKERVQWFRGQDRAAWELSLGDTYLERHDYLRAAIFFYEAYATRATLRHGGDINDFDSRDQYYKEESNSLDSKEPKKLKDLRNALAHGLKPWDRDTKKYLDSEANLAHRLKQMRSNLFK